MSLSVAGGTDVTLTTAQSQYLYYNFTGTLTGSINVIFPASAGRIIIVNNATTGAFTLSVKPASGTAFLVTQGTQQFVQIDGTAGVAQAPQNDILPFEVTLASASTTNLGATGTNVVAISGTTTITGFGSGASVNECLYFIRFTGALTLTYNSTSLILPGAASITTAAGDTAIMKYEGSGNWRCMMYQQAATTVGGTGTVNSGTSGQIAYYATSSNAVSGATALPSGTTATTQSANDSSTKVCTTAFANPGNSQIQNGYQKLPSGMILQWGITSIISTGNSASVTMPTSFSSALYSAVATPASNSGAAGGWAIQFTGASTMNVYNNTGQNTNFLWFAIGL